MTGDERAQASLERCLSKVADPGRRSVDIILKTFFACQCSEHGTEKLKRDVYEEYGNGVYEITLIDRLIQRVYHCHEPGAESRHSNSRMLSQEDEFQVGRLLDKLPHFFRHLAVLSLGLLLRLRCS